MQQCKTHDGHCDDASQCKQPAWCKSNENGGHNKDLPYDIDVCVHRDPCTGGDDCCSSGTNAGRLRIFVL